ncbi:hypothetical protein LZ31DRAFT_554299 [Colletotrichum somersetense]|nr:hypothetical protein LZ31DRAFT_554299 [Colletotrichum somersetense]
MQTRWSRAGVPRRATRGCLLAVPTCSESSAAPRDLALLPPFSVSEYVLDGRHLLVVVVVVLLLLLLPGHVGYLGVANNHPNGHWRAARPKRGVAEARLCYYLDILLFHFCRSPGFRETPRHHQRAGDDAPSRGAVAWIGMQARPQALTRSPLRLVSLNFLILRACFLLSLMLMCAKFKHARAEREREREREMFWCAHPPPGLVPLSSHAETRTARACSDVWPLQQRRQKTLIRRRRHASKASAVFCVRHQSGAARHGSTIRPWTSPACVLFCSQRRGTHQ